MRWKSMLALLCAILTLTQCALGASDTLEALNAADSLTVTVDSWQFGQMTASEDGLRVLNAFLAPIRATVELGGAARLAVLAGEKEIASLSLAGQDWPKTDPLPFAALERVFTEALPALYDACLPEEGEPEPELRNVKVQNLPRSTQRTTLVIPAETFNAAQTALDTFRGSAAAVCAHLPHAAELTSWLDAMSAVSDMTLKRLMDDEGRPVAWQLTGDVTSGGDRRKLTLYGGIDGLNAYISLKLPARSGRNRLELTISLSDKVGKKKNTWSGTVSYKRAMNKDSYTAKDTVKLTNAHSEGEQITGSIKREVTADGIKTTWTLKPDLTGDVKTLRGQVELTKKYAQTQVWQTDVSVTVAVGAAPAAASDADPTAFAARLMGYLAEYMNGLSPRDQRQLTHMLRTDSWMNGAAFPAENVPAKPENTDPNDENGGT